VNRPASAGPLAAALLLLGLQGCTGVTQSGEKDAATKEPAAEGTKPTYAPPPPDYKAPQPEGKPEPPPDPMPLPPT
jgi:hypothetical protein